MLIKIDIAGLRFFSRFCWERLPIAEVKSMGAVYAGEATKMLYSKLYNEVCEVSEKLRQAHNTRSKKKHRQNFERVEEILDHFRYDIWGIRRLPYQKYYVDERFSVLQDTPETRALYQEIQEKKAEKKRQKAEEERKKEIGEYEAAWPKLGSKEMEEYEAAWPKLERSK